MDGLDATLLDVVIAALSNKLATAFVALALLFVFLRALDWASKVKFTKALDLIEQDPHAMAVYYGLRWLGACYLIGKLLGVSVA